MKTATVLEFNHLEIAFTAAEELLKEIPVKIGPKYPVLSIAAENIEEIEMMEFEVEYDKSKGEYVLTDWVFGVRSKFGTWILSDHLYVIEELVKDRVKTAINKETKQN